MTKAACFPSSLGIRNSFGLRHSTFRPGPAGLRLIALFLLRGVRGFLHEGRNAVQFLFEAGNEVGRSIFKQDDEAEGEKHKQQNPEQSPNETHARTLTYSLPSVNDVVRNIRQSAPLMLR